MNIFGFCLQCALIFMSKFNFIFEFSVQCGNQPLTLAGFINNYSRISSHFPILYRCLIQRLLTLDLILDYLLYIIKEIGPRTEP